MVETYLRDFVNEQQNNWARFFLMTEFAYNNAKNANTSNTIFKLNCDNYPHVLFTNKIYPYSRFRSVDKLVKKLRE